LRGTLHVTLRVVRAFKGAGDPLTVLYVQGRDLEV
jgi:hypothetical protein